MEKLTLVKKAIKGNEKAFETLLRGESEKLYRTAFLYVRNKEDALDVLQETAYKAYISISKVKQPEYFSSWLMSILIRTAYNLLSKKKKYVFDESIISNVIEQSSPDIEGKLDVIDSISNLSKNYQTVIILFYYHDLTIQEVAHIMDKPENTVKTYLRRARIDLKKLIEGGNDHVGRAFS